MGTQILNDIDNDLKLLITAITGFEKSDEGFRICERFVFSNIKYHRYLSINAHDTRKSIEDVKKKLTIYGKYTVANEFSRLVDTFLTSFVFDQHPQYDLQWSLLSLLLNLSSETDKSTIECLHTIKIDRTVNNGISESNEVNEIDWGEYLKDGELDFFCDYGGSSESEWSDYDGEENINDQVNIEIDENGEINREIDTELQPKNTSDQLQSIDTLTQAVESHKWLDSNIENSWWNNISWNECQVSSQSTHAHFCQLYNKEISNNSQVISIITEYQACREVLWMFHTPSKMIVYEELSPNKFSVRPNLSISSLTPPAFHSAFTSFTKYFSMIRKFEIFEENLWTMYSSEIFPPLTYSAYNVAMKQYLSDIKQNIVNIESKAMEQNESFTFCTLSKDLEKSLSRIQMLYDIHQSIMIDSDTLLSNWEKAYKLLLHLYQEMENSYSCTRTNLCACLYLSSLHVYLDIIDTWLSEGRLEDFRDEFLISKIVKKSTNDDELKMNEFNVRLVDENEFHDPIMKKLVRKVRDMGRSIELLITLDRISDVWKINAEQYTSRVSLNDEFIAEVILELTKYGGNSVDELDANAEFEEIESESIIDSITSSPNNIFPNVEANIRKQILRINNPFLMKVFQDYLPPMGLAAIDTVDSKIKNNKEPNKKKWGINMFHVFEKISPFILPYGEVLERVLEKILQRRYSCASKLVKDILINEYKLGQHLKLMRSIYMMERGHVMKKFYQHMFKAIENNSCWMDPYNLTSILEEVLSDEWRDLKSHNHWSITVEDNGMRQVLQAIDRTNLHYSIDWPINMVLNDEVLVKYNSIFRFQLKLKWALWSLNNLRFVDLEGKNPDNMKDLIYHFYARRLESLRFWLLHAIGSIHTYLSGQVLQGLGRIFEKSLEHANNLDDIVEIHNDYLDKVYEHCLQTSKFTDVMVTINNLLGMCAHIRDRWNRGVKQLIPSELDLMESSYTKYHTYLALSLHNAVQHKEADYYKINFQNALMKDLLAEVAHQTYPPSGISIPIPPLVKTHNLFWSERMKHERLPDELSLTEYDNTIIYSWYQTVKNFMAFDLSHYNLNKKLMNFFFKL